MKTIISLQKDKKQGAPIILFSYGHPLPIVMNALPLSSHVLKRAAGGHQMVQGVRPPSFALSIWWHHGHNYLVLDLMPVCREDICWYNLLANLCSKAWLVYWPQPKWVENWGWWSGYCSVATWVCLCTSPLVWAPSIWGITV